MPLQSNKQKMELNRLCFVIVLLLSRQMTIFSAIIHTKIYIFFLCTFECFFIVIFFDAVIAIKDYLFNREGLTVNSRSFFVLKNDLENLVGVRE
jgi:hypothetical protein